MDPWLSILSGRLWHKLRIGGVSTWCALNTESCSGQALTATKHDKPESTSVFEGSYSERSCLVLQSRDDVPLRPHGNA